MAEIIKPIFRSKSAPNSWHDDVRRNFPGRFVDTEVFKSEKEFLELGIGFTVYSHTNAGRVSRVPRGIYVTTDPMPSDVSAMYISEITKFLRLKIPSLRGPQELILLPKEPYGPPNEGKIYEARLVEKKDKPF